MSNSTPEQLRFPPVNGLTIRGDFDGGVTSLDLPTHCAVKAMLHKVTEILYQIRPPPPHRA